MALLRPRFAVLLIVASLLGAPTVGEAGGPSGRRPAPTQRVGQHRARPVARPIPGAVYARIARLARNALGRPGRPGAVRPAVGKRPSHREVTQAIARIQRTLMRPDAAAGLRQITGKDLVIGQTRFSTRMPADPFLDVLPDGRVHVYGSFENYLEFDSLDDLLRGGRYRARPIPTDEYLGNETSWDHMVHRWEDGTEVMYGAVMVPTVGRKRALFPDDNWTRRIFPFTRDRAGKWVRGPRALFGGIDAATQPTMLGHVYGHHFQRHTRVVDGEPVTETWLYHEEIVGEGPLRTEIFARRMIDPYTASDDKVRIVGVDPVNAPEVGRRINGEYLVEGPRPFVVTIDGKPYSFVSFSSGDFNSDNYDLNFAWKEGTEVGAHAPMLDRSSPTPRLRGFGHALKARYGLSWLGRAQVVTDKRGQAWAVFHAVNTRIRPVDYRTPDFDLESFQRNIYAVPLRFSLGSDGQPEIEVLDEPNTLGQARWQLGRTSRPARPAAAHQPKR